MSTTTVAPVWVSISDAATMLGVGVRTLRRYIAEGDLPAYRVGKRATVRVRVTDLERLLKPIPTAGGASK